MDFIIISAVQVMTINVSLYASTVATVCSV